MELTPEIQKRLLHFMKLKKETGYTIHQKTGISATTIGNYLNGKVKKADNTKIKVICELLEISHEQLLIEGIIKEIPEDKDKTSENKENGELYYLKEIFRKLQNNDDQYLTLRKDMELIRNELRKVKKQIGTLKK